MNELYYSMIFKRKSFHVFPNLYHLCPSELKEIKSFFQTIEPLCKDIRTELRILPCEQTTCKRGEFCILIYSEKKEHYLQNVGYLGEQLDLWLVSKNIGVCWYGVGKTNETKYNGLDFVIMLAIQKVEPTHFRKDYTKAKRKSLGEIWQGNQLLSVASAARYAPSACNTQPWLIRCGTSGLSLYQVFGKRGIMPANKVAYYNQIDLGIFMLILELCLEHEGIPFHHQLFSPTFTPAKEMLTAKYLLLKNEQ